MVVILRVFVKSLMFQKWL